MSSDVNIPSVTGRSLLRQWESASVNTVWLRPGDWYTPAAEALVEALEARLDTAPSAYRLGQARAAAGVGITEAIDDMAVLFRAAGYESAPIRSIRALCEGWTEGDATAHVATQMHDPESGLGTTEYMIQRLAEVYGAAERTGLKVIDTHALVMVDVSVDDNDPWQRMARNAAVGQALTGAYGAGHPMARMGDGLYAVLVERGAGLGIGIAELRDHIGAKAVAMRVANLVRQPPRVWIESLPGTHRYAQELLESLQR
ncbi:hypothetical protein RN607_12825 [Demequina capsici]|uniref:Uncharacterized protein n=1 Tax=Demequina capsici TaxID=3075620 RepID=A0AA96JAJ7_9MICO|nr:MULTISPECIES: hypothetical protein [unclassified Demequina]WNM24244.1 hypothetical protein RN606_12885 [Demequina sp. OYTSA14]WNM27073.1 hypothetical protein RN607_12825 [Demequina sp. PMTSA13]